MEDRGKGKNVLVVMNDAHSRMTIRTTLERSGFTVDSIDDPDAALAACRDKRPDVLVVGSRLPKMDGFVFLYKLTGDGLAKVIPTILIAEPAEKGRERMALSRGAKAFMVKPIKVRKLLEHVVKLTQKANTSKLDAEHQKQVQKLAEDDQRDSEPPPPAEDPGGPIRVKRQLIKRVVARKSSPQAKRRSPKHDLLDKLRAEVRRLKRLPYHERLELDLGPKPDDVDASFRRLAMKYHPDRYKHHGKDARRLAQGVFMLLSDAKKALRPKPTNNEKRESEPPSASDSWQKLPPRFEELPESQQQWTPDELDLEELASDEGMVVEEEPASAPESQTAAKNDGDRESGERVAQPEDELSQEDKKRKTALEALADGRFRDAKNQIGRLLDALADDQIDEELELSFKLARGHLRWEEGHPEEALELFEEALEVDPECEDALRSIADVKEALDKEKAGILSRFLGKT